MFIIILKTNNENINNSQILSQIEIQNSNFMQTNIYSLYDSLTLEKYCS